MAIVKFTKLIQNTHNYNTDGNDILESDIYIDYKNQNFIVHIRQPSGVNFEETEGVELIIPVESELLQELKYDDLSDKCEEYYRNIIGNSGNGIHIEGNSSNIIMMNNTFNQPLDVDIALAEDNGTTW